MNTEEPLKASTICVATNKNGRPCTKESRISGYCLTHTKIMGKPITIFNPIGGIDRFSTFLEDKPYSESQKEYLLSKFLNYCENHPEGNYPSFEQILNVISNN